MSRYRHAPHLRTGARRAIDTAVRAQTGYPNVSRTRLRTLDIRCLTCGGPSEIWVPPSRRPNRGCWVCCDGMCPGIRGMGGAGWFWERWLDERRWRRSVRRRLRVQVQRDRRRKHAFPNRATRRGILRGLAALFRFAAGGAS